MANTVIDVMKPTDMLSVERKAPDKFFCSMCTSSFDMEAFELAEGCPGCDHMSKAEENIRGAL